jgi:hypothetical protein
VTSDAVWHLWHNGVVVAELHVCGGDFPWAQATVVRHAGFADVEPLFVEEHRLLNELKDEETAEWTAAYEQIRRETRLTQPGGGDVAEYLLHIDGDEAWWRWSDEPFDAE